jgi:two-component system, chemotaxis family, protein-glutamate methylesterase/glutaminase
MAQKIRVMLVDDSAVIRGLYDRALKHDAAIEVVSSASNGEIALNMLRSTPADIIILDIEMPVMDGLTALPEILKLSPKSRVIMSSTLTVRNAEASLKAMQLGAADYIAKPSSKEAHEVEDFYAQLIRKIHALAPKDMQPREVRTPVIQASTPSPLAVHTSSIRQLVQPPRMEALAIASSTGGPNALLTLFREFKGMKLRTPIFITQHMPANFTTTLADHISKTSGMDCHEAKHQEVVKAGVIYLAPGDFHMTVKREGTQLLLELDQSPQENFCRPSADPMLRSLAKVYGDKLLVAVLTGLGSDGARGAADVVARGGIVVAQDEATSVVYGMPKAVVDAKLTSAVFPLDQIAPFLMKGVN